jgi:hypothetical protein
MPALQYNASLAQRGTAKGLLAGVALYVPANYSYSPNDLRQANLGLGSPLPPVAHLVNGGMFPANR